MSINLLRYSAASGTTGWGVVRDQRMVPLPGEYSTPAQVLQEGVEMARDLLRKSTDSGIELASVTALNPLPGARVNCQGTNYREHMAETGVDSAQTFNLFFTKSTGSLTGACDDIVTPPHVQLLDYEIELGIVVGKAITEPVTVTAENLDDYVGAFVVANDVSARDVQLSQGQYYKGKSYRTFCPVGPYLCVPGPGEVHRWTDLLLSLAVNGETRQTALAGDMIFTPAETLTEFSQLEDFAVGDLLLTGTPGGVAIRPPRRSVQRLAGLLPEAKKWALFNRMQARNPAYLAPGDVVTASIRTDDGVLDLGTQSNTVR
ncbi:2-keto-4-pentenoate hydratase/2-oxohepta-3-ene-1,7-dioic acid hydratase in catechol pathway [Nocardia kruczakiae]|uniref:2-keto-4-pentenoate hydratase/2-oxohepta-3-ene-1,7-dioic acid hydratase in catechol pathway n=1 Tax=Nocardia kruczakiae TaxID=261477 RepID=A0ABU1XQZ5_9NOCA|nr:fumarylacetoacetate hydrolase family protein [Nocardia kruczakiae]MDR7172983.1 2-keto-4-pentenoate hydratase/2-oxohepta-3-ene-1,7-dioic acid hydratase in catechol pathway [Nocardia kruczakiae]